MQKDEPYCSPGILGNGRIVLDLNNNSENSWCIFSLKKNRSLCLNKNARLQDCKITCLRTVCLKFNIVVIVQFSQKFITESSRKNLFRSDRVHLFDLFKFSLDYDEMTSAMSDKVLMPLLFKLLVVWIHSCSLLVSIINHSKRKRSPCLEKRPLCLHRASSFKWYVYSRKDRFALLFA